MANRSTDRTATPRRRRADLAGNRGHLLRAGLPFLAMLAVLGLSASAMSITGCAGGAETSALRIQTPTGPGTVSTSGSAGFVAEVIQGGSLDFSVTGSDTTNPGLSLTLTVEEAPDSPNPATAIGYAGGTFPASNSSAGSATVSVTGTASAPAEVILQITATNSQGSITRRLTIKVTGDATALNVLTEPAAAQLSRVFDPAFSVEVIDSANNRITTPERTVTLALGTDPSAGAATLGGTLSVMTVNGVATFSDLTLDMLGAGYTLVASSTGLTDATSSAFDVAPYIDTVVPVVLRQGYGLKITGVGFEDLMPANHMVSFGTLMATPSSATATELLVTVPNSVAAGNISVTRSGLTSNTVAYSLSPLSPTVSRNVASLTDAKSDTDNSGQYVAFVTPNGIDGQDGNAVNDVYLWDRLADTVTLVSRATTGFAGNGSSDEPAVSGDGMYVAFTSEANNLVTTDNNAVRDVFRYEIATGTIILVSQTPAGVLGSGNSIDPSISEDGMKIAFTSDSLNLSPDDGDNVFDIYLRNLTADTITLVSRASNNGSKGLQDSLNPFISADGGFIVYESGSTNLASDVNGTVLDIFLFDEANNTTSIVSLDPSGAQPGIDARNGSVTRGGTAVVFDTVDDSFAGSTDSNLVRDVFLRTLTGTPTVTLVSRTPSNLVGNGASFGPIISDDGERIVFISEATNLVTSDTNAAADVFLYRTSTGTVTRENTSYFGVEADRLAETIGLSKNGRYLTVMSQATNLVSGDTSNTRDIFLFGLPE